MRERRRILFILIAVLSLLIQPAGAAEPKEETGGINILKTNVMGEPLSGARFSVVRAATQAEMEDPVCVTDTMKIDGEEIKVVYEPFYSHSTLEGSPKWQTETDLAGKASLYGLPVGTHYLLEMKAPEGYNRIAAPIRFCVNKYSHLTQEDGITDDAGVVVDNTIHIVNVRYNVPETGMQSVGSLVLAGLGVVASSTALLLIIRRGRE